MTHRHRFTITRRELRSDGGITATARTCDTCGCEQVKRSGRWVPTAMTTLLAVQRGRR